MRPLITACVVSLVSLGSLGSVASADSPPPALASSTSVTDVAALAPSPHVGVTAGFLVGSFGTQGGAGVSLELRAKILPHVSVHLEGVAAATLDLLVDSGSYYSGRGGIEISSCTTIKTVCLYSGVDAGYAHAETVQSGLFGDRMDRVVDGATVVWRGGLDIGSKHVRWVPGMEVALVGPQEVALTQSVAVTF